MNRVFLVLSLSTAAFGGESLLNEARGDYNEVKNHILQSAAKMPEENYGFKPAARVRTFGQMLGHIAEEQFLFCSTAKGEQRGTVE